MPPKHRTEFYQAEKLTFQHVAHCIANDNPLVLLDPALRVVPIQVLIIAKEVVWPGRRCGIYQCPKCVQRMS